MTRTTNRGSDSANRRTHATALALFFLFPFLAITCGSPVIAGGRPEAAPSAPDGRRPTLDAADFTSFHADIVELDFTRLADGLADGKGRIGRCEVSPTASSCASIVLNLGDLRLSADRIAFEDDEIRLDDTAFAPPDSGRVYRFETVTFAEGRLAFEDLRLRDDTDGVLTVADGWISENEIRLASLVWLRAADASDRQTDEDLGQTGESVGRPVMRSASAHWNGERWRFEGLRRADPPELRLGRHDTPRSRPTSGLLPPRLTYGGRQLEATQRAVHGPTLLGLSASAAFPSGWYGLGPTVQTPSDANPFADHDPRPALLDGQVRWHPATGELGWSLTGDARRGDGYTHVGAHLEEQSRTEYWRTGRIEAPGLLRNWRESRAGVSLSGTGHHLQIRAGHWSRAVVDEVSTDRLDAFLAGERFDVGLEYGTVHHFDEGLEASTGLYHRHALREGAEDAHRTVAVGDLTGRMGTRDRLFGELGATAMLGSELGSPEGDGRGFDAEGTSQLVAHASTGLTLSGRWGEALVHRLAPQLIAYRELASFGETDTGGEATDHGWARPEAPTPEWTAIVGLVDQRLEWPGFRLHMPVGLLAHGAQGGALIDETQIFGGIRFDAGNYDLFGSLRKRLGDPQLAVSSGAGYFGRGIDVTWQLTTDAAGDRHLGRIDRIASEPVEAIRLLQPYADPIAQSARRGPLFQTLGVGGDIGPVRTDIGLFAEGAFEDNGVTFGVAHAFEPLGWGLALDGVYAVQTERWGVSAGLKTTASGR